MTILLIYSNLVLGGIETFFVRLAKQRARSGKRTKILLLLPRESNDPLLLAEVQRHADVYFFEEVFHRIRWLDRRYHLLHPLKIRNVASILEGITMIHVANGTHLLLAERMLREAQKNIPVTVGVYHIREFTWTMCGRIPYFEKVHRKLLFNVLPTYNLMCFADSTRRSLEASCGLTLSDSQVFRLGVVDSLRDQSGVQRTEASQRVHICAVGRLVRFKTYNLWILEVVRNLIDEGLEVQLDVFGTGPLEAEISEKIATLRLDGNVRLLGDLNYSDFENTVSKYDLFIGSGTAIVQAANLGVPSIIGIESENSPVTYGFFSDFYTYEYHNGNLELPKRPIRDFIQEYAALKREDRERLSCNHVEASRAFNMDACDLGFSLSYKKADFTRKRYSSFLYSISRTMFYVVSRITRFNVYSSK